MNKFRKKIENIAFFVLFLAFGFWINYNPLEETPCYKNFSTFKQNPLEGAVKTVTLVQPNRDCKYTMMYLILDNKQKIYTLYDDDLYKFLASDCTVTKLPNSAEVVTKNNDGLVYKFIIHWQCCPEE